MGGPAGQPWAAGVEVCPWDSTLSTSPSWRLVSACGERISFSLHGIQDEPISPQCRPPQLTSQVWQRNGCGVQGAEMRFRAVLSVHAQVNLHFPPALPTTPS